MIAIETQQQIPFCLEKPGLKDWFRFFGKLPITTLNHKNAYGRELPRRYRPSFSHTLMVEYWKEITDISADQLEFTGAYNILAITRKLLVGYDDLIDSSKKADKFFTHDFKDEQSTIIISDLVRAIRTSPAISIERKDELFHTIANFRREQLEVLNKYHKIPQDLLTFKQAIQIREATNKPLAILYADILCAPFDLMETIRDISRSYFVHFCLAGQAIDDIADCQVDWQGRNPNLLIAALNEHPEEKHEFGVWVAKPRKIFTVGKLSATCPQSFETVRHYVAKQTLEIPQESRVNSAIKLAFYLPKGFIK